MAAMMNRLHPSPPPGCTTTLGGSRFGAFLGATHLSPLPCFPRCRGPPRPPPRPRPPPPPLLRRAASPGLSPYSGRRRRVLRRLHLRLRLRPPSAPLAVPQLAPLPAAPPGEQRHRDSRYASWLVHQEASCPPGPGSCGSQLVHQGVLRPSGGGGGQRGPCITWQGFAAAWGRGCKPACPRTRAAARS